MAVRKFILAVLMLIAFAGVARAQFFPVDDDDTNSASPLSTSFNLSTDTRSRSEMPSDPDARVVIFDDRFGRGERFTNGMGDDDDTSSSSASALTGASAALCAVVLIVL